MKNRPNKPKFRPRESVDPELEATRHFLRNALLSGLISGIEFNQLMKRFEKRPGPHDIPHFSLREGYFNGYPVVEVLKNGGPVHIWDEHFRFGVRKAQILVASVDILREFWRSTDEQRLVFEPREIRNPRYHPPVGIKVEMHPDFAKSTGEKVERPWLRLQALPPDEGRISLGVMKCRAIFAIKEDLKRWLGKHGDSD